MTSKEQHKQRAVGITILCVMALIVLFLLLQSPEPEQPDMDFSFPSEPVLTPQPKKPVVAEEEREQIIEQVANDWREQAPTADEAEQMAVEQDGKEDAKEQQAPYLSGWAVQLWSLRSKERAQDMVQELNQAGFSAFVRTGEANDKTVYRVYAGPELTKSSAQALLEKLKQSEPLQISQGLIVLLPE